MKKAFWGAIIALLILAVALGIPSFAAAPDTTDSTASSSTTRARVCLEDSYGMQWYLTGVKPYTELTGYIDQVPCGQTNVPVTGTRSGRNFVLFADQTATEGCCEGFTYEGTWSGNAKTGSMSGTWYNTPDSGGSGTFTMWRCGAATSVEGEIGTESAPGCSICQECQK